VTENHMKCSYEKFRLMDTWLRRINSHSLQMSAGFTRHSWSDLPALWMLGVIEKL
jgi:hypothetical protein